MKHFEPQSEEGVWVEFTTLHGQCEAVVFSQKGMKGREQHFCKKLI